MNLILQKDVKNLGKAGDQVSVKNGFARNFLIPKGYALLLNKNRLRAWNHQKIIISAKKRKAISERKILIDKLSSIKLLFEKESQKDNKIFGSVTAHEISQALEEKHNISVDKKDIHFSELKTVGNHKISIRLDSEHQTEVFLAIKGKVRKKKEEKAPVKQESLATETISLSEITSKKTSSVDTEKTSAVSNRVLTQEEKRDQKEVAESQKIDSSTKLKAQKNPDEVKAEKSPTQQTEDSQTKTKTDSVLKTTPKEEKKSPIQKRESSKTKEDSTNLKVSNKEEKTAKVKSSTTDKKKDEIKKQSHSAKDKKVKTPSQEKTESTKETKKSAGLFKKIFGKKK